jgi:hypothetical protein
LPPSHARPPHPSASYPKHTNLTTDRALIYPAEVTALDLLLALRICFHATQGLEGVLRRFLVLDPRQRDMFKCSAVKIGENKIQNDLANYG